MASLPKLSFSTALVISINIMLGTGIFINTVNLAKTTGALGSVVYCIVALLLVPLIRAIAVLLHRYPVGGFYTYAAHDIGPLAGFISAWAYFIAKLASTGLLIHVFSSLITQLIPGLAGLNPLVIDGTILTLFAWLNLFNVRTSSTIMYSFLFLKVVPVLTAILSGLHLWRFWHIPSDTLLWSGIPFGIPLVLYAFTGFEACCSLSASIENAEINAPRAVRLSFIFVVLLTVLYQFLFFAPLGHALMAQPTFWQAFPTLFGKLMPSMPALAHRLANIIHIAFATAALGGSYGILLSNHWNLYTLAQHGHVIASGLFTRLNNHAIPALCVLAEAVICGLYLLITRGDPIPLQQISVLGCTIAYTLSIIGMLNYTKSSQSLSTVYMALISCFILLSMCIRNFFIYGFGAGVSFALLLVLGIIMYRWQHR